MNSILSIAKFRWLLLILCIALFAACSLPIGPSLPKPTLSGPSLPKPMPLPTNTPEYQPFQKLLQKVAASGPVYVTGDSSVPDRALQAAGAMLAVMLQHRPDIGIVLRERGTFTAVASRSQVICDLPYFSSYDDKLCKAYGEGGAGGTFSDPITACDEKNLLAESDDPYQRYDQRHDSYSENVCVHELAHTIMNVGLSSTERDRIDARFLAARQEGIWQGDYAMTNDQEFWAIMSQFYFWAAPKKAYETINHIANGPDALKRYDPASFALLDSIYQGSADLR